MRVANLLAVALCASAACRHPEVTHATSDCEADLSHPASRELLEDLSRALKTPSAWSGYHLKEHDLVLEWRHPRHSCVAHWSRGELVAVTRAERPLAMSVPLFGFLVTELGAASAEQRFGGFLTGEVPPDILASLRARGADGALALLVNLEAVSPEFAQETPQRQRFVRNYLVHHESAHVHLWLPSMMGRPSRHAWPVWSKQPKKQQLMERCYQSDAARPHFTPEFDALARALAAAVRGERETTAREAAAFVRHREARHHALEGTFVDAPGAPVWCAEAEAVWELDEGAPDAIAFSTLRAAELMTDEALLERISQRKSVEPYYHSGAAQLLILAALFPQEVAQTTRAIATSASSADGIHGHFRGQLPRFAP